MGKIGTERLGQGKKSELHKNIKHTNIRLNITTFTN